MGKYKTEDIEHEYQTISAKTIKLKKDYTFFIQNPFFKILSFFTMMMMKIFLYYFYGKIFRGLRIKNKHNLKHLKTGRFIMVANHMHVMDAVWVGTLIFPRKMYGTMLQSNLGLPVVGKVLRAAGGIPIPETKENMVRFLVELKAELSKKTPVLVMPEAAIKPYHVGIRKFLSGAFRFAVDVDAKILPMVFVYKKPRGLMKLFKKKPWIHLHVLEPVEVVHLSSKHETLVRTKDKVHQIMSAYFNKHSDLKEVKDDESTKSN